MSKLIAPPPPLLVPPPPPTAPSHPGVLSESDLHDYQNQMISKCVLQKDVMLWCGMGTGKEQPLTSKILTVNGWSTMGEMEIGSKLIHPMGGTSTVVAIHPQGLKDVYELTLADGRIVECGIEHLWCVKYDSSVRLTKGSRKTTHIIKTAVLSTKELMIKGCTKYTVISPVRLDFEHKQLPIEPYILGCLIGDGSIVGSSPLLSYHVDDRFIIDKCLTLVDDSIIEGADRYTSKNGKQMCFKSIDSNFNKLKYELELLGLWGKKSHEKFIPEVYMTASHEQRLELLRGLMDTDGSINSRNRKRYATTSKLLADNFIDLCRSLGCNASCHSDNGRFRRGIIQKPCYTISVSTVNLNPFSLPRKANKVQTNKRDRVSSKIKSIVKTDVKVLQQCITLDRNDGLYLTDNYVVTHNTVSLLTAFVRLQRLHNNQKMVIVAPLKVCQLTWMQEAIKWSHCSHLTFAKMYGTAKQRQLALYSSADIYLINYEGLEWLKNQLQHYFIEQNLDLPFNIIAFDEISKMKRPESKRFKNFSPISRYFKRHYGLTASPSSNGMINVWAQYFMLDQGARLGQYYKTFTSRFFTRASGSYGKLVPYDTTRDEIVKSIADITIEISSEAAGYELPELSIIPDLVVLTPKLMKQYLDTEEGVALQLAADKEIELFNKLSIMNALRQFSSGSMYHYKDKVNYPDVRTVNYLHDKKEKALADLIEDTGSEPIFLAYQFTFEKDMILKKYDFAQCLTGADEEESIRLMNEFNAGKIKLLIAHTKSAGYGINLQSSCSLVVMYGLPWSLEEFEQFIGRVHRQGNKSNKVRCVCILTKDTIDEEILKAIQDKDEDQRSLKERMRQYLLEKHLVKGTYLE